MPACSHWIISRGSHIHHSETITTNSISTKQILIIVQKFGTRTSKILYVVINRIRLQFMQLKVKIDKDILCYANRSYSRHRLDLPNKWIRSPHSNRSTISVDSTSISTSIRWLRTSTNLSSITTVWHSGAEWHLNRLISTAPRVILGLGAVSLYLY